MERRLPASFALSPEVSRALRLRVPLVALESTVITHGLPYPDNLSLAEDMETTVRSQGAVPATIALIDGRILVGLTTINKQRLATDQNLLKISLRDYAPALVKLASGGTTVAGTLLAARTVGIKVFATGGIGGVHHDISGHHKGTTDISADLPALGHTRLIVVCSGAKAILDLPATLEYLETIGVPVVGFQTDDFPAFYSPSCGLPVSARADSADEVALIAHTHWELGLSSAVLVVVPPPPDVAIPYDSIVEQIRQALIEAQELKLRGPDVSPFLLKRMTELTSGDSLKANLGLLVNNARVAAQIARAWARLEVPSQLA